MLMTEKERNQFLETCNLLGVAPFDALGYKPGQLFMLHWAHLMEEPGPIRLVGVTERDTSLAQFKSTKGQSFLVFFHEVTPYELSGNA